MFDIARAEGDIGRVGDELYRFARALETSDELRDALTDPHLPASRRQQIVEDLLGGKADPATVALVGMAVGTGRARELPEIIDSLVAMSAAEANKVVAEVRSAIELTEDQRDRLAVALEAATGKSVEVKVVVDPTILGGLHTTIGDTVIDGSVRTRLERLKQSF
jgi:F-type H+-transporting ATPase subunit delta